MGYSVRNVAYEDLPLLPYVIAETVCERPYVSEFSAKLASADEDRRIGALQRKMTQAQISAFARKVDERCRHAYERRAPWFMKCVRSKTNAGRDQLYAWITHWLHGYLRSPSRFLSSNGTRPARRRRR